MQIGNGQKKNMIEKTRIYELVKAFVDRFFTKKMVDNIRVCNFFLFEKLTFWERFSSKNL